MSMPADRTDVSIKRIVLLYRAATLLTIALTFILFISGSGSSTARTVAFMVWLALEVYSLIRILSDLLSGQHKKEQNFRNTLANLEKNMGDPAAALRTLWLTSLLSLVLKLAVPVVLWAIFR